MKDSYFSVSVTAFLQPLSFDNVYVSIRTFAGSSVPMEHSHHRSVIASRHIHDLMISHLGSVLPTLPGFIHHFGCMQEIRPFALDQHDGPHFKCQRFSCNFRKILLFRTYALIRKRLAPFT